MKIRNLKEAGKTLIFPTPIGKIFVNTEGVVEIPEEAREIALSYCNSGMDWELIPEEAPKNGAGSQAATLSQEEVDKIEKQKQITKVLEDFKNDINKVESLDDLKGFALDLGASEEEFKKFGTNVKGARAFITKRHKEKILAEENKTV